MRFLEYRIEPTPNYIIEINEGRRMFDVQLKENYGHAGVIYAKVLIENLETIKNDIEQVVENLCRVCKLDGKDRFWARICACNIVGGYWAQKSKLHSYNMAKIYKWVQKLLLEKKEENNLECLSAPSSVIGDYINNNLRNILVINSTVDNRTNLNFAPDKLPTDKLLIRIEPDVHKTYLTTNHFRTYCGDNQIEYKPLLNQLKSVGIYLGSTTKRLSTGTTIKSAPVNVLELNTNHADFVDLEIVVETLKEENEDRGSDL